MIRCNSWLPEEIKKLKKLASAGNSMRAIALEMGRSEHAIRKQASKYKIVLRRARLGGKLTGEVYISVKYMRIVTNLKST